MLLKLIQLLAGPSQNTIISYSQTHITTSYWKVQYNQEILLKSLVNYSHGMQASPAQVQSTEFIHR